VESVRELESVKKPAKPVRRRAKKPRKGMRVEVFWTKKDTKNGTEGYYKGLVKRHDRKNKKVIVQYDNDEDGSVEEDEDFGGNKWWELVDEDP